MLMIQDGPAQTNCGRCGQMKSFRKLWSYVRQQAPSSSWTTVESTRGSSPVLFDRELVEHIQSLTPSGDWTKIELPGRARMLVDRQMIEYIQSRAPQPTQQSLDTMLEHAHAFRIMEGGVSGDKPLGNKILFEARDEKVLASLRHFLQIVDGPAGHGMCHGDTAVELLDESDKCIAAIGVHHGINIRWSAWKDDAALVDGLGLLKWLADHGIQYPLQNYLASQRRRAVEDADWKRWLAAMPPCLQPLLADQQELLGMVVFDPPPAATRLTPEPEKVAKPTNIDPERWLHVTQALQEAYPDGVQRAQVLFQWFGRGGGAWNGFATYEQVADYLLMDVPIDDILRALHGPSLPQPLLEGAARFLAGWTFTTRRGAELDRLPAELRQRLLEYCVHTQDPDKQARAAAAFRRQTA